MKILKTTILQNTFKPNKKVFFINISQRPISFIFFCCREQLLKIIKWEEFSRLNINFAIFEWMQKTTSLPILTQIVIQIAVSWFIDFLQKRWSWYFVLHMAGMYKANFDLHTIRIQGIHYFWYRFTINTSLRNISTIGIHFLNEIYS